MGTEHGIDRSVLRFAEEVKDQFSFLKALGFRFARSEATFVRLESSKIGLNIFHGRHSFEIGLEIDSLRELTDAYPMPLILSLVNPKRAESYRYYATHTKEGVTEGVRLLAADFQMCVDAGILSDNKLFFRLKPQGKRLCESLALETELLQARRKSEAAWHKKDYAAVVKALKPLRAALTATEVGKLEFAETKSRLDKHN